VLWHWYCATANGLSLISASRLQRLTAEQHGVVITTSKPWHQRHTLTDARDRHRDNTTCWIINTTTRLVRHPLNDLTRCRWHSRHRQLITNKHFRAWYKRWDDQWTSNTPFTPSRWLDQLLYVSRTSQLDVCSMFARSCKRGIKLYKNFKL